VLLAHKLDNSYCAPHVDESDVGLNIPFAILLSVELTFVHAYYSLAIVAKEVGRMVTFIVHIGFIIDCLLSQGASVSNGSGPSLRVRVRVQTETVAKLAVRVVNKPELPTRVRFRGKLPTRLNWAGCQRVAQRVHL